MATLANFGPLTKKHNFHIIDILIINYKLLSKKKLKKDKHRYLVTKLHCSHLHLSIFSDQKEKTHLSHRPFALYLCELKTQGQNVILTTLQNADPRISHSGSCAALVCPLLAATISPPLAEALLEPPQGDRLYDFYHEQLQQQ